MLDLVHKELTEGLHLLAGLKCVDHCNKSAHLDTLFFLGHVHNRDHNIGKLGYTGRLHQDTIRMVGSYYLMKILRKIAHKGTADTTTVDLRDLNTGVL